MGWRPVRSPEGMDRCAQSGLDCHDRTGGQWFLFVLGSIGFVYSATVIWGVVGANSRHVRSARGRYASLKAPDRARFLAAIPFGTVAVFLGGLLLVLPDPAAGVPLAVATIGALVVTILVGSHPRRFLPPWALEIEDRSDRDE